MSFTDLQKRRLSSKLSEKHVKSKQVSGATLSYVEGWHVIAEANRIFGFDAWDRVTQSTQCVWNRTIQGRYCCVYTAKVRVSVRAGETVVVREGNGTGEGIGSTVGAAHDVAIKAAETDATKRALATFGNPFGLALYDKEQTGVRRRRQTYTRTPGETRGMRTFHPAEGEPKGLCGGPEVFLMGLRKALDTAETLECLETVWTHNCSELDKLRKELPDLCDGSGQHYADVLLDHCEVRASELRSSGVSTAYGVAPCRASATSGKIDKAQLALSEPKRIRSKEHLMFVASQPCLVCDRRPAQAHHVQYAQPKAMARKVSDEFTVPLCKTHHRQLHEAGNERDWWSKQRIDPLHEASRLWDLSTGKAH